MKSLGELVLFLASTGAIGVVSTYVTQGIKKLFPMVADEIAVRVSVIVAAVVSLCAFLALPYMRQLPPIVEQVFPVLAWLVSYIWFQVIKPAKAS